MQSREWAHVPLADLRYQHHHCEVYNKLPTIKKELPCRSRQRPSKPLDVIQHPPQRGRQKSCAKALPITPHSIKISNHSNRPYLSVYPFPRDEKCIIRFVVISPIGISLRFMYIIIIVKIWSDRVGLQFHNVVDSEMWIHSNVR